ncbi:MAG: AMP-binding protein, partial [Clostridia bacterium]|nr:AMP-binding protein [Clostridia bacterium]
KFVFSSEYILKKVPNFLSKCPIIDISKIIYDFKRSKLLKSFFKICLLRIRLLTKIYNVPEIGNDSEALLLFSSGSTGIPKGIPLSHKNIIGNCLQLSGRGIGIGRKSLLSCLPNLHSFGLTVNIWFALMMKMKVFTVGSPLEYKKITNAIYNEKVDVLVSTSMFSPY